MMDLSKLVLEVVLVWITLINFGEAYQHCSSFCETQPDKYICCGRVPVDGDKLPKQPFGNSGLNFRNGCEMACFNSAQITRGLGAVKKIKNGPCINIRGDEEGDGNGYSTFNRVKRSPSYYSSSSSSSAASSSSSSSSRSESSSSSHSSSASASSTSTSFFS